MSPQQVCIDSVYLWDPAPMRLTARADHSVSVILPDGSHRIIREIDGNDLKDLNISLADVAAAAFENWRSEQLPRLRRTRKIWRDRSA